MSSTRKFTSAAKPPAHPYRRPAALASETLVRPFSAGSSLPVDAIPAAPGAAPRYAYRQPPRLASRTITPLYAPEMAGAARAGSRRPWLVGGFALAGALFFAVPVVQAEAKRMFEGDKQ